jgi:senataxin
LEGEVSELSGRLLGVCERAWRGKNKLTVYVSSYATYRYNVFVNVVHRYFGAFPTDILEDFFRVFDDWELGVVLGSLEHVGILSKQHGAHQKTLSDAPSSTVYHMVSNLRILQDPRIIVVIRSFPPAVPFPDWPINPLPAGLLILTMDENPDVQAWAKAQAFKSQGTPIPIDQFTQPYRIVVEAITEALTATRLQDHPDTSLTSLNTAVGRIEFSFTSKPVEQWAAFSAVLRLIPRELLTSSTWRVVIRRIVTGHLHNIGPGQWL